MIFLIIKPSACGKMKIKRWLIKIWHMTARLNCVVGFCLKLFSISFIMALIVFIPDYVKTKYSSFQAVVFMFCWQVLQFNNLLSNSSCYGRTTAFLHFPYVAILKPWCETFFFPCFPRELLISSPHSKAYYLEDLG